MKKFNYIVILGAILCCTSSCADFLEEKMYSQIGSEGMYQNQSQADMAVMGIYSTLSSNNGYNNVWQSLGTYGTDEARCFFSGKLNNFFFRVSNFSHTAGDSHISKLYENIYSGIGACNDVIYNVERMDISQEAKAPLLAEASFLRAFFYFNLVQLWGDVRLTLDPPSFENVTTRDAVRTPVKDVYRQIITDIEAAKKDLPFRAAQAYRGRASRYAAYGLAAKIYLTIASGARFGVAGYESFDPDTYYALAKDDAQTVMTEGKTKDGFDMLTDFGSVFDWHNKYNDEILFDANFAVGGAGNAYPKMGGPTGAGKYNYYDYGYGGRGYLRPSIYLALCVFNTTYTVGAQGGINGFSSQDKRFGVSIANFDLNSSTGLPGTGIKGNPVNWYAYKFNLRQLDMTGFTWNATPVNHPILRVGDVVLIYAEAAGMLDLNDQTVYDAINRIRDRAGLDDLSRSDVADEDAFMDIILDERMRELCFEGHRRFDLLRTSRLFYAIDRQKKQLEDLTASIGNETFTNNTLREDIDKQMFDINIKPYHVLFPIPQYEMNIVNNPAYRQNPGWVSAEIESGSSND